MGIDLPSMVCSKPVIQGLLALGYSQFKSSHQAMAIERILAYREDLLAVMPTGGGKSLLFLLPVVVERGRYTTVVICPSMALKRDMVRCLKSVRLVVEEFTSAFTPTDLVDVLLVSVELCSSKPFQIHLRHLYALGRLGRIVMDECHLVVMASP